MSEKTRWDDRCEYLSEVANESLWLLRVHYVRPCARGFHYNIPLFNKDIIRLFYFTDYETKTQINAVTCWRSHVSNRARICTWIWRTSKVMLFLTTEDCHPKSLATDVMKGTRNRVVSKCVKFWRVGDGEYGNTMEEVRLRSTCFLGVGSFKGNLGKWLRWWAYFWLFLKAKYLNEPK